MKVYKLYGASTSTANAVAQLDFTRAGNIVAIAHAARVAGSADYNFAWEVSFASAAQAATNDTVGPIYEFRMARDISLESETCFDNGAISGFAIPVGVGDRLYLHLTLGAGTLTSNQAAVYLYVME